jgi:hypothetical protein
MTNKGLEFTRLAIAMARAKEGDVGGPTIFAANRWGDGSLATRILKAGGPQMIATFRIQKANMPAGSTLSGSWGEALTAMEAAETEFFALVRERSLIGRIAGLRAIPLQTRLISAATGVSGAWVAEGKAIPVGKSSYAVDLLPPRKVAALTVLTKELLESSDPTAELLIRDELVGALTDVIDLSFIDPSNAGVDGVEPAAITNGAPATAATGDALADLRDLIAAFPGDLERAVLIGSPQSFAALHDPLGLPNLGVRGGEALGIPAIPSKKAGDTVALVDPDSIAIGEAEMDLRIARQASIEMVDNPAGGAAPDPSPVQLVSLYQTNSVAIMAEKVINWEVARPAVATLTGVNHS